MGRTGTAGGAESKSSKVVTNRWRSENWLGGNGGIMGSIKKWMLGAALAIATLGLELERGAGSAHRSLRRRSRAGSLCSALPWSWIFMGRGILGQRLLDAGLLELRRRGRWPAVYRRPDCGQSRPGLLPPRFRSPLCPRTLSQVAPPSASCTRTASPNWRGRFFVAPLSRAAVAGASRPTQVSPAHALLLATPGTNEGSPLFLCPLAFCRVS